MCEFEACMGSTALALNSLAGRTKNGWDSTHSWSRCHFKPKPGYRSAVILTLLPPDGRLTTIWAGRSRTKQTAVTELALSRTANTIRQGEWDSLCDSFLLCRVSSVCTEWLYRLTSCRDSSLNTHCEKQILLKYRFGSRVVKKIDTRILFDTKNGSQIRYSTRQCCLCLL